MAAFLPSEYRRVLEVGCGEGAFAVNLKPGCEVWGIEPNQACARIAAQKMHRALHGRYDQVAGELPDQYFDLVISNDVIEHMQDHEAFLRSVHQKMTLGGRIVASVPNVRHFKNLFEVLVRADWRYRDAGLLDRTHLRFFTERSVRRTLCEQGFVIEELRGVNSALVMPHCWRDVVVDAALLLVIGLTLGHSCDIQYLQFGVRAVKVSDPAPKLEE